MRPSPTPPPQVHYDIVLSTVAQFLESRMPAKLAPEEKAAWARIFSTVKAAASKYYADQAKSGK